MLLLTQLTHLISDADFGIGIIKNVRNAHQVGFSMLKDIVLQFLINAKLMLKMEIVLIATKVTI